jgi:hypothetical protein
MHIPLGAFAYESYAVYCAPSTSGASLLPTLIRHRYRLTMARRSFLAMAVLGQLVPTPGTTQEPLGTCAECEIVVEELVALGTEGSGARLSFSPSGSFRDSKGRFWISPVGDPPMVFDSAGRLIAAIGHASLDERRVYQRRDGFMMPGGFFQVADSIGILDIGFPRIKVVGPDLRVAREIRLPGIVRRIHVIEWPTNVIASASVNDPRSSGWPLHEVHLSGPVARVRASFGDNGGQKLYGESSLVGERRTVQGRAGLIWGAEVLNYRLHLYSAESGGTLRSVEHSRDWLHPQDDNSDVSAPGHYIGDITGDPEGRL